MVRRNSFSTDDNANKAVTRYEEYIAGKSASGYFDVEEYELIVEYYLRKGRAYDGNEAIKLGLKTHPNSSTLYLKRAKVYLAIDDAAKAYRILERLETSDYETCILKIETLIRLDREKEAEILSENIMSVSDPENRDYVYLDLAFIYMNKFKFEMAVKYLEKGLKYNPENIDLLFELAYCYEQIFNYEKAIETHNRVIDLDPYTSEAWFNLGQMYFSLQDYGKALEAYDYVLAIDSEDSFVYMQKGHILTQLEQYEEAIACYREYARLTQDSWQINVFIAECYEKLERFKEAIGYYEIVLNNMPDNYEALTGISICLMELEEYTEAMGYLREAAKLKPTAYEVWVYMAEAFTGMDDSGKALSCYLRSLDFEPHQPETLLAIGNIYLEQMNFTAALDFYMSAYEMDSMLEHIHLFLAVANFKSGHMELALMYLKEAIESDNDAVSLFLELCPEAADLSPEL